MDALEDIMLTRAPTARRPLLGLTVLIVEDSRFTSEAVRLLCLRSGARIRRADSLETARRHLAVYRPSVVMVDIGLPDGSGLELIKTLTTASPRIEVIFGISGDDISRDDVIAAGADGFIEKPFSNLAAFQTAILTHLPLDRQPPGPRVVTNETVTPDRVAYHDDLHHIATVLQGDQTADFHYVTQFLGGVARSADDHDLDKAVRNLVSLHGKGQTESVASISEIASLSELVQSRIANSGPI